MLYIHIRYDIAPVEGIATDLSHCDIHGEVIYFFYIMNIGNSL